MSGSQSGAFAPFATFSFQPLKMHMLVNSVIAKLFTSFTCWFEVERVFLKILVTNILKAAQHVCSDLCSDHTPLASSYFGSRRCLQLFQQAISSLRAHAGPELVSSCSLEAACAHKDGRVLHCSVEWWKWSHRPAKTSNAFR